MPPDLPAINSMLARAADADGQTDFERAAALSTASRIVADNGLVIDRWHWPDPPPGWAWQGLPGAGGHLVRPAVEWTRYRGGKFEQVATAETLPDAGMPVFANGQKLPPAMVRLLAMASVPGGVSAEEISSTTAGAATLASKLRRLGFLVTFDRKTQRYRAEAG